MKIDLEKYSKLKTYKSFEKDCYYDKVSKELRIRTPKEIVRLSFVEFLHDEIGIPYDAMELDVSISDYDSEENGYMDIGVFGRDEDKCDIIILVVGCRAKGKPLNDEVFEEVCNYADIAEAPFVALTNGEELELYYYDEEKDNYEQLEELLSYDGLCEKLSLDKYSSFNPYQKIADKFSNKEKVYKYLLEKTDIIGEDTEKSSYPIIVFLEDLFMNHFNKMKTIEKKEFKVCDLGTRYASFGNFNEAICVGDYRFFKVENKLGNTQIVGMGLFAFKKIINNMDFNNLLEKTYLTIVVSDIRKQYNSLDLEIDKSSTVNNDEVVFFDNLELIKEKDSSFKREVVIEYLKNSDLKFEIENEKIIFGRIKITKELNINDSSVQGLLVNLINYALLLDKLKSETVLKK